MMKKIATLFVLFSICFIAAGFSQTVNIVFSKASPQAAYAARLLKKALSKKGINLNESKADVEIKLAVDAAKFGKEAYSIINDGSSISVTGGDERGMIYGSLSIMEDIGN